MTDKAIEAGARAIYENWANYPACSNSDPWSEICEHRSGQADDFRRKAKACIEAAIASGALVPASADRTTSKMEVVAAVAEMRERCAKLIEDHMTCGRITEILVPRAEGNNVGLAYARAVRDLAPACGEYVVGWQDISTAPKDGTEVDLWCLNWEGKGERWCRAVWSDDWDSKGRWEGPWSDGYDSGLPDRRLNPTHWMLPPNPPVMLHAATRTGGEK